MKTHYSLSFDNEFKSELSLFMSSKIFPNVKCLIEKKKKQQHLNN